MNRDRSEESAFLNNPTADFIAEAEPTETVDTSLPSESELFDLYEKIAEARPGSRDAEIFEKIHEWVFSDHSLSPHKFAGITKAELDAWQKRNRINLSGGHIRPSAIDLARGYAWGQIRMTAHVNRLHSEVGPPSAAELMQMA